MANSTRFKRCIVQRLLFLLIFLIHLGNIDVLQAQGTLKTADEFVKYIRKFDQYRSLRIAKDLPTFSDKDYRHIYEGKPVTIIQKVPSCKFNKAILGRVVSLSAEKLWCMIMDRNHFDVFFPNVQEAVILNKRHPIVDTFFFIKIPLVANRYSVTGASANAPLARASQGLMMECTWNSGLVSDPLAMIQKGINSGKIKTSRKHINKAVMIKQNQGAWLFIKLPDNRTLFEYYLFNNPGGEVPGWLINKASKKTLKGIAKRFKNYDEKTFDNHFKTGHEPILNFDGKTRTFAP